MVEVMLPVLDRSRTFASPRSCRLPVRRRVPVTVLTPRQEGLERQKEVPCAAELAAATREVRRLEMERLLCEKLGVHFEASPSPGAARELREVRQVRPTSAGPTRPPKPKPHRPIQEAPPVPVSAEELPRVRRWKSALTQQEEVPKPMDLSRTAPAMLEDVEISASPYSAQALGLAALPQAPLSLEASPAGASRVQESPGRTPSPEEEVSEEPCLPDQSGRRDQADQLEQLDQPEPDPTDEPEPTEAPAPPEAPPEPPEVLLQPPTQQQRKDDQQLPGRQTHQGAKLLEASSRRLREKMQVLRLENRRHRVHPASPRYEPSVEEASEAPHGSCSVEAQKRLEELRRRVAALEARERAEKQRLKLEQEEAQERRRQQEAFERTLQEQIERELKEHHEREAVEAEEQAAKEREAQREMEERALRRKEQQAQEEERSRQLEEQRLAREGQRLEEQERHWAEQEAEERRRVDDYARDRHRQFEEWERTFAAERLRFASEAEFCAAARRKKAKVDARADEQFYASQRAPPREPAVPVPEGPTGNSLGSEERGLLKELQSVQSAPKDLQKAKVKDLLIRWHPDKNPDCQEKAKQVFQFLQQQRRLLGL